MITRCLKLTGEDSAYKYCTTAAYSSV